MISIQAPDHSFSRDLPTNPGIYITRSIDWQAAHKEQPGRHVWRYTIVDIRRVEDKEDGKKIRYLEILFWGSGKNTTRLDRTDLFRGWEWAKLEVDYGISQPPADAIAVYEAGWALAK